MSTNRELAGHLYRSGCHYAGNIEGVVAMRRQDDKWRYVLRRVGDTRISSSFDSLRADEGSTFNSNSTSTISKQGCASSNARRAYGSRFPVDALLKKRGFIINIHFLLAQKNILITGAAGYIGGSVLADFIARTTGSIKDAKISAAVRSEEQAQALTKLGVNVILVNLDSKEDVVNSIVRNDIDVVVHTASSVVTTLATNLIRGLGQRRKIARKETYFIHSSVAQAYTKEGNWPYGEVRDTDAVYEREKEINDSHHVRVTNIAVIEESKAQGVSSFIVPIPYVYGRGKGQWRRLSVNLPLYIQASLASRSVHKFEDNANPSAAHISDVTAYYSLLVEKILSNDPIPSGEEGYYFIAAHKLNWWESMHQLAQHLHKRGLIEDPEVHIWPSYDVAADTLGLPRLYVRAMCAAGGDVIPVKASLLGWKPEWDEKRFMESLDDEIQAVLDLNTTKNTLFQTLL